MARRLHFLIAAKDRLMELDGTLDPDERVDTDAVAVPDEADGFVCAHDFIHFPQSLPGGLAYNITKKNNKPQTEFPAP